MLRKMRLELITSRRLRHLTQFIKI